MNRIQIILIVSVLVCGCGRRIVDPPRVELSATSDRVAAIVAHTQSAENHVISAQPHADPTGKIYLAAAQQEHAAVLDGAAEARGSIQLAQQSIQSLSDAIAEQRSAYSQLEARWYVRWGRRLERALWIIGIGWLLAGAASVILGTASPLSLGARAGKELVRLVPMMNAFAWVRDWINARRTATAAGGPDATG